MSITFSCVVCRASLEAPVSQCGQQMRCPGCRGVTIVPLASPAALAALASRNQTSPLPSQPRSHLQGVKLIARDMVQARTAQVLAFCRGKPRAAIGAVTCVFVAVIAVIVWASSGSKKSAENTPAPAALTTSATPKEAEVKRLTAQALLDAYKNNIIAADQKYKGQVVELEGVVLHIGRAADDTGYVIFDDDDDTEIFGTLVLVNFTPAETPKLAAIQPKQKIAIRGKVDGKKGDSLGFRKAIVLRNCDLIP